MKSYLEKHHKTFGVIGGIIAFAIAIIYLKVTPDEARAVNGVQRIILIYGHSLCWVMLSAASIGWAFAKKNTWSKILAWGALATYITFMSTLLASKFV